MPECCVSIAKTIILIALSLIPLAAIAFAWHNRKQGKQTINDQKVVRQEVKGIGGRVIQLVFTATIIPVVAILAIIGVLDSEDTKVIIIALVGFSAGLYASDKKTDN